MNYRINIVRTEANPEYKELLAKYEENFKYNNTYNRNYDDPRMLRPEPTVTKDVLITELTEEQFEAVRRAVLEKF